MDLARFLQISEEGYTHIPVVQTLLADLDTPLSVYLKLASGPFSYLLESALQQERFGRYSFIGLPTDHYLKVRDFSVEVYQHHQVVERFEGNPLGFIENYFKRFKVKTIENLPDFQGGMVGYFSYEINQYYEKRLHPNLLPKAVDVPDIFLLLSQEIAVVDNFSGKIYLIVHARAGNKEDFERAQERLSTLREKLRQPTSLSLSLGSKFAKVESEISDGQFKKYVEKIRRYIYEGECMQVVPSRRLIVDYSDSPLNLYRALRTSNPSPFLLYYDFGDFHIAGASPELLLRKRKDIITVRPLAGTRRRGQTPEEDLSLEQDLLHDEKELAEHMMLIDLGRNDVSKISEIGSVKLTEKMQIERYSHVMHIVSNVQGQSRAGTGLMDILASTFPAGTLSGAPKIRAMEIIQELEPSRRGIYGGALGYLSFAGDIDLAIGIRTAIIKDKKAYLQTGAGIVADSNPERELQETKNKVLSLLKAIRNVEEGLDN